MPVRCRWSNKATFFQIGRLIHKTDSSTWHSQIFLWKSLRRRVPILFRYKAHAACSCATQSKYTRICILGDSRHWVCTDSSFLCRIQGTIFLRGSILYLSMARRPPCLHRSLALAFIINLRYRCWNTNKFGKTLF